MESRGPEEIRREEDSDSTERQTQGVGGEWQASTCPVASGSQTSRDWNLVPGPQQACAAGCCPGGSSSLLASPARQPHIPCRGGRLPAVQAFPPKQGITAQPAQPMLPAASQQDLWSTFPFVLKLFFPGVYFPPMKYAGFLSSCRQKQDPDFHQGARCRGSRRLCPLPVCLPSVI